MKNNNGLFQRFSFGPMVSMNTVNPPRRCSHGHMHEKPQSRNEVRGRLSGDCSPESLIFMKASISFNMISQEFYLALFFLR